MSEKASPTSDKPVSASKRRKPAKKAAKSAKHQAEPVAPAIEAVPEESKPDIQNSDWPEPEMASTETTPDRPKKKRRRKKGKGGQAKNTQLDDARSAPQEESSEKSSTEQAASRQHPRSSADPQLLAKRAWKIYLAEVSEEGVALIGDTDAKDLARRCFRLAEIFIEEQSRRR